MAKKRKINKFKLSILILLFLIIILTPVYLLTKNPLANNLRDNTINVPSPSNKETKEEIYTANMIMVGDALIHDRLYNDAYNGTTYDFKPYLKYIKEIVSSYDIAYYNQETILGGTKIGLSSYPSFNSPQELGDAMIDAGFNLVSLATNHTLDRGKKAVLSSREYWNTKSGVQAVGSYSSKEEKDAIESKILTVNNITYAMLNYTYGTNGIPVPSGEDYLVNLWSDTDNYENYKKTVENDINHLRDKVDVLIVAMHWGREYTHEPLPIQKKTAKYLSSLGVDIIIGTHAHVIEPVEWVGDTLVFYSLGNFISAQTSDSCKNYKCNIGLMSSLTIKKEVKDGTSTIEINNIKNDLIYTYHKNYHDYLVIPFSNPSIIDYLQDYENVYNNYSSIIKSNDERISLVPLSSS